MTRRGKLEKDRAHAREFRERRELRERQETQETQGQTPMALPAGAPALVAYARNYAAKSPATKHAEHGLEDTIELIEHLADVLEGYAADRAEALGVLRSSLSEVGTLIQELTIQDLARLLKANAGDEAHASEGDRALLKGPLKGFSNADRRRMADEEANAGDEPNAGDVLDPRGGGIFTDPAVLAQHLRDYASPRVALGPAELDPMTIDYLTHLAHVLEGLETATLNHREENRKLPQQIRDYISPAAALGPAELDPDTIALLAQVAGMLEANNAGDAPMVDPVPETARAVLELMASKGRYLIELTLFEEFGDSDERQILNAWLYAGMPMSMCRPASKTDPVPETARAVLEVMASKNKHVIGFMFEEFEDPDDQQIISDWLYAGMPTGRESAQASEEPPSTELIRKGEFPADLAWVLDGAGLHVELRATEIERLAMALKGGQDLEILVRLRSSSGERS